MSLHLEPLSSLPQLRGLLEVTRLVRDERDLTRLVDGIAETISESLGWSTVAINLYRPAEDDFEVTTVHGNEEARDALLGTTRPADGWAPVLAERFLRRGAYLIPHDEAVWAGMPSHIPDLSISSDPNAWHPEDALVVPMRGADGTLLWSQTSDFLLPAHNWTPSYSPALAGNRLYFPGAGGTVAWCLNAPSLAARSGKPS
jgi:hypothetical protein